MVQYPLNDGGAFDAGDDRYRSPALRTYRDIDNEATMELIIRFAQGNLRL